VLKVLLSRDQGQVIALLSRIERRKAEELIKAVGPSAATLKQLPAAAEAMADCRPADLGQKVGPLTAIAATILRFGGYFQDFAHGRIYWSEPSGAQVTRGEINRYRSCHDRLEFPTGPETAARRSPFGTDGSFQEFYSPRPFHLCTVYWSKQHGCFEINRSCRDFFERNGGTAGPMGFPISEVTPSPPAQVFEGGVLYFLSPDYIFVRNAIVKHHVSHGGPDGELGMPIGPESPPTQSEFGTTGTFQDFAADATVYVTHRVHCVRRANRDLYLSSGGPVGWLGFPRSDEIAPPAFGSSRRRSIQRFEGGSVYFADEYRSVAVSGATIGFIAEKDGLTERLGFPVLAEVVLDPENGDREQLFEHGLVTVRDGIRQAWIKY
jgi:uncharacterized protein with LGFP repeats